MAMFSVGVVVRSRASVAATLASFATSRVAPPAIPAPPSRPSVDPRFVSLVTQGLRSAEEGALVDAARLLRSAIEVKPDHAETWSSLGVVLVRAGETSRGVDAFRRALRLDPSHAEAHRNLAVALDRSGKPGEAAIHYRAFLRLSAERHPSRDDVRRRLAEVALRESGAAAAGRRVPGTGSTVSTRQ